MDIQKDSQLFFIMPVNISRLMKKKKKKKSRNSREKTQAMETHFYTINLFFLSPDIFYEHSEIFPTIFYYAPIVFLD